MKQRLYIKDGKIYDIKKGVRTNNETILYNGSEEDMRALGYEPYIPEELEPSEEMILTQEIESLKEQLAATDYISLKELEGYDCDSLYPNWKENRRSLREQINEKEEALEELDKVYTETPIDEPSTEE